VRGCTGAQNSNEELRYQATYHIYLASGGQLLCTLSVELVVHWTIRKTSLFRSGYLSNTSSSREKRYQALPAFLYCKRWKARRSLGTRLL